MKTLNLENFGDSLMRQQFETLYNLSRGARKLPVKDENESGQVKINGKLKCSECGEWKDDPRVEANLKCADCSYSPYDN